MAQLVRAVAAGADDGHIDGTSFYNSGIFMYFGQWQTSAVQHPFLRFDNITIPAGATIDSAYLSLFYEERLSGSDNLDATVYGQDEDDPIAFDSYSGGSQPWTGRTPTTASVAWQLDATYGQSPETVEEWITSPDIKSIIQELVDRGGWASGDAILLYLEDEGPTPVGNEANFEAYEDTTTNEPYLTINYSTAIEGAATLNGVGTLAATAEVEHSGAATVTGVGTLVAIGTVVQPPNTWPGYAEGYAPASDDGSASLIGVGTLAAAGQVVHAGSCTATGVGVLVASWMYDSAATLVGRGTLFGYVPPTVTPASVRIAGYEPYIEFETFDLLDRVGERSTCSFVAWDVANNGWHFKEGHPVLVVDPLGNVVFDGFVKDVEETVQPGGETSWRIDAVDFHYLTDKRIVADAYATMTAGAIVQSIISTVLSQEGVQPGTIEAGPTLAEVAFGYVEASRALDSLASLAAFTWWIDHTKTLHFRSREGVATATVTSADPTGPPRVRRRSPDYRNRQYVRGVQAYTDPQVESFIGDGTLQNFLLAFKVGQVPTVKVNTVEQTVGIRGLDQDKDWYWQKGDNTLSQENQDTPLAATDTLEVTYRGLYDIVVVNDDVAEQTRLAALEGAGTGRVEATQNVTDTFGRAAAFDVGAGLLNTYSVEGCEIQMVTARSDLHAGQYVQVQLPEHDIDGQYLVTEITSRDFARADWLYDVQLIEGADPGSWAARLAGGLQPQDVLQLRENITEDETLLVLAAFYASWAWAEAVTQTVLACPVPSTTLYPVSNLYPC